MKAKEMGIGYTSVQKIWAEFGQKPHLTMDFKISNDFLFAEKIEGVVGLCLNTLDRAIIISVDEKKSNLGARLYRIGIAVEIGASEYQGARV